MCVKSIVLSIHLFSGVLCVDNYVCTAVASVLCICIYIGGGGCVKLITKINRIKRGWFCEINAL